MRYILLIYSNETDDFASAEEMRAVIRRYSELNREMQAAGVLLGGDGLERTNAATTVRVRGGETRTSDGPFAETKEQLGGYYLIDVPDLDQAIHWASRIPTAERGSVEIRPIMDYTAYT